MCPRVRWVAWRSWCSSSARSSSSRKNSPNSFASSLPRVRGCRYSFGQHFSLPIIDNNTYSGEIDHVVMYVPDGSDISSFIEEFFHEDRTLQDTSMALVTATELHVNTKALLVKPQYGLRVEVMRGELNVRFSSLFLALKHSIFRASSIRSASK